MARTRPQRERAGLGAVAVVVLVLALLGGGAYAAAYAYAGDDLPRDTEIAGVRVGAMGPAAATAALERGLAERLARPITVRVDGRTSTLTAAQAGIAVDAAASVARAARPRSWDPRDLWDHYTAPVDLDPVVTVDQDRLTAALAGLTDTDADRPVDATVTIDRTGVRTTPARAGRAVDPQQAGPALAAAVLDQGDPGVVELSTTTLAPAIDDADAQRAVTEFANPAMAASVVLRFGDTPVRLQPREYAGALSLRPEDGALVPHVAEEKIARLVRDATGGDGKPVDATVRLVDGKPRVVPARPGVDYEPDQVVATFTDLLTEPEGQREAEVTAKATEPTVSTAEARGWRIKEPVSSFTTYFPYAEYRNTNIGRAAQLVDGTVLQPGQTFSLNDTVGERTRANGFTEGFIISDGVFKEDLGGGVSQVATTLFNAAFFAGLEDVEHQPHSFYIDRYPVGREATVAWGSIDLRFRDDTRYGVLIDTDVVPSTPARQGSITVTLYSTKVWDITSRTGPRYDLTAPATRTLRTPDCQPFDGYGGFSIDVDRVFRKVGQRKVDHTERFHTVYTPADSVRCAPPKG